jgi:hypothetical protein
VNEQQKPILGAERARESPEPEILGLILGLSTARRFRRLFARFLRLGYNQDAERE